MVPTTLTLTSKDNLITLCANCHMGYDFDMPYWVMVPDLPILNGYIRHERRDYQRRLQAAAQGQVLPRNLPLIDKQNAVYYRFIMDPGWASRTAMATDRKVWAGEPTSAILKSVAGLGQPCVEMSVNVAGTGEVRVGVIENVRSKVNELIRAWSRPAPMARENRAGGESKGGKPAEDGNGEGGGKLEEPPGNKRKRSDDGGGLAYKRLLRPRGGNYNQKRISEWLKTIVPGSPNSADKNYYGG